jgi:hypothetical protein
MPKQIPEMILDSQNSLDSRAEVIGTPDSPPHTSDATSPLDEEAIEFLAANKLCTDQLFYSSSTSSDATSIPAEHDIRFSAAQARCLDRLVFDRWALPDGPAGFQLQGPANLLQHIADPPVLQTTIIDRHMFEEQAVPEQVEVIQPTSLEIVPWQPVGSAVALHILANFITFRQGARNVQNRQDNMTAILLPGPTASGPEFEFETPSGQPSPPHRHVGRPPKPRGSTSTGSSRPPRTSHRAPLVETSVKEATAWFINVLYMIRVLQ